MNIINCEACLKRKATNFSDITIFLHRISIFFSMVLFTEMLPFRFAELTPEQQKILIDIRRKKTELLLEIQVSQLSYFLASRFARDPVPREIANRESRRKQFHVVLSMLPRHIRMHCGTNFIIDLAYIRLGTLKPRDGSLGSIRFSI